MAEPTGSAKGAGAPAGGSQVAIDVDADAGLFFDDEDDELLLVDGLEGLDDEDEGDDDGETTGDDDEPNAAGDGSTGDGTDGDDGATPEGTKENGVAVEGEEGETPAKATEADATDTVDGKFRAAVEPLIKDIRNRLVDAVRIPEALAADDDGSAAIKALANWSESGTRKVIENILSKNAVAYVAREYKLAPEAVESLLKGGDISEKMPTELTDDLEYMSDRAQEIVKAAFTALGETKAKLAETEKAIPGANEAATKLVASIREEQFGDMIDSDFDAICAKLRIDKNANNLEEKVGYAVGNRKEMQDTLQKFRTAVHNGDKNDAKQLRKQVQRNVAILVKEYGEQKAAPAAADKGKETTDKPQVPAGSKKQTAKPPVTSSKGSNAPATKPPVKAADGYIEDDKERNRVLLANHKKLMQKHGFAS